MSKTELHSVVTVVVFRFDLRDHIRSAFDHRCWIHNAGLIEDLRHTQLSVQPFPESLALS